MLLWLKPKSEWGGVLLGRLLIELVDADSSGFSGKSNGMEQILVHLKGDLHSVRPCCQL